MPEQPEDVLKFPQKRDGSDELLYYRTKKNRMCVVHFTQTFIETRSDWRRERREQRDGGYVTKSTWKSELTWSIYNG